MQMVTRDKKPKNLTEDEIIEKIQAYETIIFNIAWNDKEHLDILVDSLANCRRELAFRGHVYRAI